MARTKKASFKWENIMKRAKERKEYIGLYLQQLKHPQNTPSTRLLALENSTTFSVDDILL